MKTTLFNLNEIAMFTYLEIIEKSSKEVVHRMDVTNQSERSIERIEDGMNINLNHAEYKTAQTTSETELPTGDL